MMETFHSAGAQLTEFEGPNRLAGEAVGYITEFENGLTIHRSGDTSLMGDIKTIVGDFHKPHRAILLTGEVFTMGSIEVSPRFDRKGKRTPTKGIP